MTADQWGELEDDALRVIRCAAPELADANLYLVDAALLAEAAYGLPEFFREQIRPARLVSNPGC